MNSVPGKLLIEASGLGRCLPSSERYLIEGVSLQLHAGNRVAVVGLSGSGKTLLLRAIALLDHVDEGEIRWHGMPVSDDLIPEYRSKVIYLHQTPSLMEGTVEDILQQPFSLKIHATKQYRRDWIVQQLESLGRDELFLKKQQRDLSGGESQLAALLRAIQLEPEVLLLDEPTSALDAEATNVVELLVVGWVVQQSQRRAVIWVTHDLPQAERTAETIYRMKNGKLEKAD